MSSEYFAAATEDEEGTELANIHARVDGDRALDVRVPPVLMLIIVPCRQRRACFTFLTLPFSTMNVSFPPSRVAEHI